MKAGISILILSYVLSQFYRAFLAVLAPELTVAVEATPQDLSFASGIWFLVFAAMQIPVGAALDRIGPRKTSSVLLLIGGAGGAAVFAMAQTPDHITLAMGLIGLGCSPVLMAAYYIFARAYPPAVFATLAGMAIGIGTLGNIGSSLPLSWAVYELGWRKTMFALALVTALVALLLFLLVRDPEPAKTEQRGSFVELLRMPVLWPIFAMMFVNYAAVAGLRGLWVGPYFSDIFAAGPGLVGTGTLIMSMAMVAGNFIYGPMDRLVPSKRKIIFFGNLGALFVLVLLASLPAQSFVIAVALLALLGVFGSSYAVVIAHGRGFFPDHLMGRGVSLLNLFGIAGVGLLQAISGRVFASAGQDLVAGYQLLFTYFAAALALGLVFYWFSRDA